MGDDRKLSKQMTVHVSKSTTAHEVSNTFEIGSKNLIRLKQ